MELTGIDNLGAACVLERGTGEVVDQQEHAMLVYDTLSRTAFLACEEAKAGISLLERHRDRKYPVLSVTNLEVGRRAFRQMGYTQKMECYQVAYYGKCPEADSSLAFRTAEEGDLPLLTQNYHLVSPEDLARIVSRGNLLMAADKGRTVGFIGEHLEGSMGLLFIFPEFRHRGYAMALEKRYMAKMMGEGRIPFGQVEKKNQASLALQKKIGVTRSRRLSCWMWDD